MLKPHIYHAPRINARYSLHQATKKKRQLTIRYKYVFHTHIYPCLIIALNYSCKKKQTKSCRHHTRIKRVTNTTYPMCIHTLVFAPSKYKHYVMWKGVRSAAIRTIINSTCVWPWTILPLPLPPAAHSHTFSIIIKSTLLSFRMICICDYTFKPMCVYYLCLWPWLCKWSQWCVRFEFME